MKVCIIGNSHTACLKRAWDDRGERFAGHEATFFASTANTIMDMEIRGDTIVPTTGATRRSFVTTSGERAEIDPGEYDQIVLYGMGGSVGTSLRIKRCTDSTCVSRSFRTDAVLKNNPSSHYVYSLFQRLRVPHAWICPRPNPAGPDINDSEDRQDLVEQSARVWADMAELSDNAGFGYMQQPTETLHSMDRTCFQYKVGGYGLGLNPEKAYRKIVSIDNNNHMNGEYGSLMLDTMFASFSKRSATGPDSDLTLKLQKNDASST